MIPSRVLFVSDDFETARVWVYALQQAGIETSLLPLPSDKDDTERRPEPNYDLIVIDIHATQASPAATVRRLRDDATIPILLILPHHDERNILDAYEAGADEVIPSPICFKVFLAKITAWLRRSWTVPTSLLDSFQVGEFHLDTAQRQLVKGSGAVVKLTGLEFRLLHLLMSHSGQVMDSGLIVNRVWGARGGGDSTLLKNLVYRVRRKIEPDPGEPRFIQAMAGEGYIFVTPKPE